MVKILYEGEDLRSIMDEIKEESFVIMDAENRKQYPEEPFIVIVSHRRQLEETPLSEYIYLSSGLRKELELSEFPERIFLKELKTEHPFPKDIGLSGDLSMAWNFVRYLLGYYLFSVGLTAKGYAQKMFLDRIGSLSSEDRGRVKPCMGQPLQFYWEDSSPTTQLFFWSGREEDLFAFKEKMREHHHVWMVFKKKKHLVVSSNQEIVLWKRLQSKNRNYRELWERLCRIEKA